MTEPLWTPSPDRIRDANLTRYRAMLEDRHGLAFPDYPALHRWSVEQREAFWISVWEFCGVIAETRGETVLADGDRMPGARWFPDAKLNFAENLLRRRDGGPAILFRGEDRVRRTVSRAALYDLVSRLARAFEAAGVAAGDRVAGYLPNIPGSHRSHARRGQHRRRLVVVLARFRGRRHTRPVRPDRAQGADRGRRLHL